MINVYTDGSCNLKLNKAGLGIYYQDKEIFKSVRGKKVTNNIAELCAIIEVFSVLELEISKKTKINIYTDSNYSILCATTYGEKCEKKNWPPSTLNAELVKNIYTKFKENENVEILHIKAHTNKKDVHSLGNSKADILARKGMNI